MKADAPSIPLAVGQEGYFKTEWMPVIGAGAFNLAFAWEIVGRLSTTALADALDAVGHRHDALRVRFVVDGDEVRQEVTTHFPHMRTLDLSHLEAIEAHAEAKLAAEEEGATPFDLCAGHLYRALLIKLAPDRHVLTCIFHHAVFDGPSFHVWKRELTAVYRHLSTGSPLDLDPAPSYVELVEQQRGNLVRHRSYWASQVPRMPVRLDLPVANREPSNVWRAELVPLDVSRSSCDRLSTMCTRLRVTMFACMFGAFAALIARAGRKSTIGVAVVFGGRVAQETQNAVGMFATNLYAWADLSGNPTVAEFLSRVQTATIDALRHSPCPGDLVPRVSDIPGINYFPRRSPPASSGAAFLEETLEIGKLDLSRQTVLTPAAGTGGSLCITLAETESGLEGFVEYNHGRYSRANVERFVRAFESLLDAMPDICEARINDALPLDDGAPAAPSG